MSLRHTTSETQRGIRRLIACVFVLALCLTTTETVRANSAAEEYALKAAFLFHFARFVEWPEGAFQNASSPVVYCTIGEDPFQGALDESLREKTIEARMVQVRHLKDGSEAQGCHVVFIGKTGKKRVTDELASLADSPVLTVGETDQFLRDNGMIAFCTEENKIRFSINLGAVERANLRISSRLLILAKTVIGKPKRD